MTSASGDERCLLLIFFCNGYVVIPRTTVQCAKVQCTEPNRTLEVIQTIVNQRQRILSWTVIRLSCLQSTQKRRVPSFCRTSTTLLAYDIQMSERIPAKIWAKSAMFAKIDSSFNMRLSTNIVFVFGEDGIIKSCRSPSEYSLSCVH